MTAQTADDYYSKTKKATFGGLPQEYASVAMPHVDLSIRRPFNDTSPFLIYDLIVEMYQNEGVAFNPIALTGKDEGMKLTLAFEKADDWQPHRYTSIFLSYGVYETEMKLANKLH